jgi:metal-responsive CopG/Arc/MetJ family transcriptional regulator
MGRNHPAFADSPRERASVHIQEGLLEEVDNLVDRSPRSDDSRSQQLRHAARLWVRVHEELGNGRTDEELIEDVLAVLRKSQAVANE